MADLTTLQTRLDEAEAALHTLVTGRRPVRITIDGHTSEYTPARADDLRRYIGELKQQIAGPRRPVYLSW